MFRREIGEWADWKKTQSAVFQNIIREGLDPESLAFCFLPDDVQKRLMNWASIPHQLKYADGEYCLSPPGERQGKGLQWEN